jgi:hypothetical protein
MMVAFGKIDVAFACAKLLLEIDEHCALENKPPGLPFLDGKTSVNITPVNGQENRS